MNFLDDEQTLTLALQAVGVYDFETMLSSYTTRPTAYTALTEQLKKYYPSLPKTPDWEISDIYEELKKRKEEILQSEIRGDLDIQQQVPKIIKEVINKNKLCSQQNNNRPPASNPSYIDTASVPGAITTEPGAQPSASILRPQLRVPSSPQTVIPTEPISSTTAGVIGNKESQAKGLEKLKSHEHKPFKGIPNALVFSASLALAIVCGAIGAYLLATDKNLELSTKKLVGVGLIVLAAIMVLVAVVGLVVNKINNAKSSAPSTEVKNPSADCERDSQKC